MSYFDVDKRKAGTLNAFTGSVQPSRNSGLTNVPSYQISGLPFITGSATAQTNLNIGFDTVSRWIVVTAKGGDVKLAFTETGIADANFIIIPDGLMSPRLEVMANGVWLTSAGAYQIMAGLTSNILSGSAIDLTNYSNV